MIAQSFSSAAASTAARASTCFVYGTLMSPDVLRVLLGRVPTMLPNARLHGHSRHPVRGMVYPGVIPVKNADSSGVEGVLLLDITSSEMKCLDYFEVEGTDYIRSNVEVEIPGRHDTGDADTGKRTMKADAYIWTLGESKLDLSCGWDYDVFLQKHLEWYRETVVRPCRDEIERTIL